MTLRLLPGASIETLMTALNRICNAANDARAGDGTQVYEKYIRWAVDATRSLGYLVSQEDLDRLVLTRRYWTLQSLVPGELSTNLALQLELEQAANGIAAARDDLQAQLSSWPVSEEREHVLVPDTNVFLHHEQEFPDVPWEDIVNAAAYEPIHIVVPLVVIDELDQAKRRQETRSRARTALKHLDRMALKPRRLYVLRQSSQDGQIDVRVLSEGRGHVRLPRPDAELVDVVRGLGDLLNRDVTIVTFDTGMVVRARAAEVRVKKLE
jgi:rRNA-processing protein FCF1